MKEHVYSVTCNTTTGGVVRWYEILVLTTSQAKAKEIALEEWNMHRYTGHPFRLTAERTNKQPTHTNTLWHLTDIVYPNRHCTTYV